MKQEEPLLCPECKDTKLEVHFDGHDTWVCCDCGNESLFGSGDQRERATEFLAKETE